MKTALAVGLGALGVLAAGGLALAATSGSKPAAPPAPLPSSFNTATAIPTGLGGSITIPLGSGLLVELPPGGLWQAMPTTSNAAVMAPSQPLVGGGFVAVALGQATLTGTYLDSGGAPFTGSVAVTVVAVGTGAIGSGGGTGQVNAQNPGSSGGGTSLAPAVTASSGLPSNAPDGLVASGPTPTGWQESIAILPQRAGLSYMAIFGDQIRVSLPPGAHWRQSATAIGPRTGTDDYLFTFLGNPITLAFAYTDAGNLDTGTTLSFSTGALFAPTAHLSTGDYVILSISSADVGQVAASYASWQASPQTATPEQQQEVAAVSAAVAGIQSVGTIDLVQAWALLAMVGPWARSFGVDVHTWALFRPSDALPSWWPSDDTAHATEVHFFYRYIGPGIDVASLPFPVMAWKRVA